MVCQRGGRHSGIDDIYERDDDAHLEHRIGQIMDQHMEQMMETITERMTALMRNQHRQRTPEPRDMNETGDWVVESDGEEEGDYYEDIPQIRRRRPTAPVVDDRRWEAGMRIELPEFHGSLEAEEFIDWAATVDDVLEFKVVPADRRVPLVATRLRGRASAWWQQLKLSRSRLGKSKISSWEKMKKHMRAAFLPYNYQRILYQRLQNLKQGTRSVEEYTTEFYQLMARNEIQETNEQMVARYIGGLKLQIQDTLNVFNIMTVSEEHQRALTVEKQS